MFIKITFGAIAIILVVGIIFYIVTTKNYPTPIKVETLHLETIIAFFKRADILQKLETDKNLKAVAIKNQDDKLIVLACYDTEKEEIIGKFNTYKYKSLDADLEKLFADKDLIIFE